MIPIGFIFSVPLFIFGNLWYTNLYIIFCDIFELPGFQLADRRAALTADTLFLSYFEIPKFQCIIRGTFMCGFVGFTTKIDDKEEKQKILGRMMNRIIHRGPDMGGCYVDDDVALGFRRLSIIDLSEAAGQPFFNEDRSVALLFNGEIYNFKELRADLQEKGHTFASETDSEVLVHGWEEYGEAILKRLRGMYSFVIWDQSRKLLLGARDIFGIKPHYYTRLKDGSLLFGSEIKSFLEHPYFEKQVNREALLPYLTFQYSALPETFFAGVYKLPPAHYYTLQNGEFSIQSYWDVSFAPRSVSFDDAVDSVDRTVRESVEAHKISDVKVGSFLSGGVDSSYITAALMPDKTFSVGFARDGDSFFDETSYAKELSEILGIENFSEMLTPASCFDAFPDIQYHMDEPQSNPSSVPLYFLAKLAKKHVTVVLSGEGADELFAGYDWYADTAPVRRFKKTPAFFRHILADIVKKLPSFKGKSFILRSSGRPEDYFMGQALVFSGKEAEHILTPAYRNGKRAEDIVKDIYKEAEGKDELTKKQYLDMKLWLPGDILLKADKMSMAHSLELRVPFLDKLVMEEAESLPASYKVNEKDTKYVLRKAANKTLPDAWADRKKAGFPVPIRYWLCEEPYYNLVKSYFVSDYAAEFFDRNKIVALLDEHYQKKANNGRKIWTVYTFLVWYKRFFIDER